MNLTWKRCKVNLGSSQIGVLLRLVRLERARAESLNQKLDSYQLARIECHLMKGLAPKMKPFKQLREMNK